MSRRRAPELPWYRRRGSPYVWEAGQDGIGHYAFRGMPRTICGIPAITPRYGWPIASWCRACEALLGEVSSNVG